MLQHPVNRTRMDAQVSGHFAHSYNSDWPRVVRHLGNTFTLHLRSF